MTPSDLPESWRTRASELRAFGAEPQAVTLERAALELEQSLGEEAGGVLSLAEAAEVSGYAPRTLREMIANGRLENAGAKHRPRVRRGDLPKRAPRAAQTSYNPADDAARLLARRA